MAANVSSSYTDATPSKHTGVRVAVGLLGLAALVIGIVLLFNPVAAAKTLALLIGLSLLIGGLLEIAVGWDSGRRWASVVLGAILVIGGILAAAWPGATLFTVAFITGLSLIVHGAVRVGVAIVARREIPGWGWLALAGAVNVLIGVIAIAWPQATVFVLSFVLGLQIAVFGLLLLCAAFLRPGARTGAHTG
ncbi:HdeD family acid-resistance protein [Petropleomorpha daqingensis]|uniref:Uncharacterized membrane protein HdeD (DUF308 family) n=1 Tax=Petropleomorpha daqingensis TaxID=2026353 RepID=A0A853CJ29_9ACTN|nr:DUF308 domain-containing protein [Petropleomorpha daqingensis]NYJ07547.1 uncharacterized membrane protein HdeD (DUF308 family) [Petropleomorpha daqingensis]